jgi:hypothetical protein
VVWQNAAVSIHVDVWVIALALAALSPWCVDLYAKSVAARVKKRTVLLLADARRESSEASDVERP